MLDAPDALRQRCIDLSVVIANGNMLFSSLAASSFLFDERYRDRATAMHLEFQGWYTSVLALLNDQERPGFERIRDKPMNPTWNEAWDVATGRQEHTWVDARGDKRDLYNTRVMPYLEEMLDYVTTLRLRLFPSSDLPDELRLLFAERFRNMTDYVIDELFTRNGCLIDWRVAPRKPTGKKSVDRALGWIDGLILYIPNELLVRLQEVYQSLQEHRKVPRNAPLDEVQSALTALLQPAAGSPLSAHQLHPMVEQVATRYWTIGAYDTALLQVCVALDNQVQAKTGSSESGTKLMRSVFSPNKPILTINPRFGNQQGFMDLFAGVMDAIRNPRAHHQQAHLTREEALEWLAFLSALFRVLDAATP